MASMQETVSKIVENNFATTSIELTGGFIPFISATDGLTAEQAATVPAEGLNSVWGIVHHIIAIQETVLNVLQGEQPPGVAEGWPAIGDVTEGNWQAARQKALDVNHRLAEKIASLTDEQLDEVLTNYFNLVIREAIVIIHGHISYHTAEIVTMRHMQGWRVNHLFAGPLG